MAHIASRIRVKASAAHVQARRFSHFENYSKTSQVYDSRRRPVGVDQLEMVLRGMHVSAHDSSTTDGGKTYVDKSFKEFASQLRVLDAGCGTGNYIPPLQRMGVGSIVGLEFNEGMLEKCKAKVEPRPDSKLELHRGSILDIPFEPQSFDFVMSNLVLHHVDDDETLLDDYANTRQAIGQLYRQLRGEGSILWLTTSLLPGIPDAFWEYSYLPSCREIAERRYHAFDWWKDRLMSAGFKSVETHVIPEPMFDEEVYWNLENIFDEEWRMCDSMFANVTQKEIDALRGILEPIIENDAKKAVFISKYKALLEQYGHTNAIIARK